MNEDTSGAYEVLSEQEELDVFQLLRTSEAEPTPFEVKLTERDSEILHRVS